MRNTGTSFGQAAWHRPQPTQDVAMWFRRVKWNSSVSVGTLSAPFFEAQSRYLSASKAKVEESKTHSRQ